MTDAEIQALADELWAIATEAGDHLRGDRPLSNAPDISHLLRTGLVASLRRSCGWCEPFERSRTVPG